MPQLSANGIELAYECFGARSGRPLILIRGLATQMIHWDPRFCEQLVAAGHWVVVFDNRDVGLSTHFADRGVPLLGNVLQDLAAGMSMGGMITQELAIAHPDRLRSITSIMSSAGALDPAGATPEAQAALLKPSPAEREAYVESILNVQRSFAGGGFPLDEAGIRDLAGRAFDRAFDPEGVTRQMAAVAASGDRRAALAAVRVPALVIHGAADPLIPLSAGEATAAVLAGAKLEVIPGMGHELPEGAWPALIRALTQHTAAAESAA
jgi:pimeloyl-ACP methyl ester carboxylesterase